MCLIDFRAGGGFYKIRCAALETYIYFTCVFEVTECAVLPRAALSTWMGEVGRAGMQAAMQSKS